MTVVAVLSQPLRQKEAAQYLSEIDDERTAVISQATNSLDKSLFPSDTAILEWSTEARSSPSVRTTTLIGSVKKWLRGGSSLGLRIDRWLRSAEWRLRYLDRAVTVLDSRQAVRWDFDNEALIELLESCFRDDAEGEVAIFDLFDLPAVLKFAEGRSCRVVVR